MSKTKSKTTGAKTKAKTKAKKPASGYKGDDAPLVTIGDLRKRLRARGNPWQPDPRLSDDEPIPRYPMGGDDTLAAPSDIDEEGLDELLRSQGAPSNPELQKVWRKEGLLEKKRRPGAALSKKDARSDDRG